MSNQHSIDCRMDRKRYTSWSVNRPTRPTFLKEEPQSSKKSNHSDSWVEIKKAVDDMVKINREWSDKLADPATVDKLTKFIFGRSSRRTDNKRSADTVTRNSHEEFEKQISGQVEDSVSTQP